MNHFDADDIPQRLQKRPTDGRGYPVPFFVAYVDGEPDFRVADPVKFEQCDRQGLCGVCGQDLDYWRWMITGPVGFKNRVSGDPPMHEECAEFSLRACPYLAFEYSGRRRADMPEYQPDPSKIEAKPPVICLVKARKTALIDTTAGVPATGGRGFGFRQVKKMILYEFGSGRLKRMTAERFKHFRQLFQGQ